MIYDIYDISISVIKILNITYIFNRQNHHEETLFIRKHQASVFHSAFIRHASFVHRSSFTPGHHQSFSRINHHPQTVSIHHHHHHPSCVMHHPSCVMHHASCIINIAIIDHYWSSSSINHHNQNHQRITLILILVINIDTNIQYQ